MMTATHAAKGVMAALAWAENACDIAQESLSKLTPLLRWYTLKLLFLAHAAFVWQAVPTKFVLRVG